MKANKDPENTAQNTPMRRISTTSNTSPASSADPIAGTVKRTLQAEKEQELSPASKVRKAYGISKFKPQLPVTKETDPEEDVLELVAVQSSQSLHLSASSSGEEAPPHLENADKEGPPDKEDGDEEDGEEFHDYFDEGRAV